MHATGLDAITCCPYEAQTGAAVPHIVLPKPPSDNQVWRAHTRIKKGGAARVMMMARQGAKAVYAEIMQQVVSHNILSAPARAYVNDVRKALGGEFDRDDKCRTGVNYKAPCVVADGEMIIMLYRPVYEDRRRDAVNGQKIVIDTLFDQDKYVHPWILPMQLDKEDPRVELWLYSMPRKS